jgi:putative glycosyltransferase (TIGR04372 family)
MTNYISLGIPPWYGNDLFIPKLLFSNKKNRLLSFAEILHSRLGFTQCIGDFTRHEIAWIDNSADEIREVVEEMMDRLDNGSMMSHDDLQQRWAELARAYDVVVNSRMGDAFLVRHQDLLEDTARRASREAA